MINQKIQLSVTLLIFFINLTICSSKDPIVCTLKFEGSEETIPISQSQCSVMGNLQNMFKISGYPTDPTKPITIPLSLDREVTVPRMVRDLVLPLIDYSWPRDLSDYGLLLLFIKEIKQTKNDYGWDYLDFKNATKVASRLQFSNKFIERALANCCYDERPAYFKIMKERLSPEGYKSFEENENFFIQGTIIQQNLLLSLRDLPGLGSNRDPFNFRSKNLRTLKGFCDYINNYVKNGNKIEGESFFFQGNFIQDINELFECQYKNKNIFKNNKIYLTNNQLSDETKKICNKHNEIIDDQYDESLSTYTQAMEANMQKTLSKVRHEEDEIRDQYRLFPSLTLWTMQFALVMGVTYKLSDIFVNKIIKISPSMFAHYFTNSRLKKLGLQLSILGGVVLAAFKLRNSRVGQAVLNTADTAHHQYYLKIEQPIAEWFNKDASTALKNKQQEYGDQRAEFLRRMPQFDFYIYD
jgi:hypothetical protein